METDPKTVSFDFPHGLGDASNFAHAIPLWVSRGYKVEVNVSPDKACLFEAAGATITNQHQHHNGYSHPPAPGVPLLHDGWSGNKAAWNLSQKPMPDIGRYDQLWDELLAVKLSLRKYLPKQSKKEIDEFVKSIDGPLVLMHSRGNTGQHEKNFGSELEVDTYREILSQTDATLLLLDWDARVARLNSRRVFTLADDFRKLTVPELAYLYDRAACLIGVDSGPLHLSRFTEVPAIGVWFQHHPAHFALPRSQTAHIVTSAPKHTPWNRARRHSYNVVECGERHSGAFIAGQVARVLAGKVGRDLVGEHLLDKVRQPGKTQDTFHDRDKTFRLAIDHLKSKASPVVVETGCIRLEDDWTAGFSTYTFGHFLAGHGGTLQSVDLEPRNVEFARKWTSPFPAVTVHQGDSRDWLSSYSGPKIDLLYLDSADTGTPDFQAICLREAELALPHLAPDSVVLIDDTFHSRGQWQGKGATAIPWLQSQGCSITYSGYQTLLSRGKK